jgi:hypothetical protein
MAVDFGAAARRSPWGDAAAKDRLGVRRGQHVVVQVQGNDWRSRIVICCGPSRWADGHASNRLGKLKTGGGKRRLLLGRHCLTMPILASFSKPTIGSDLLSRSCKCVQRLIAGLDPYLQTVRHRLLISELSENHCVVEDGEFHFTAP